MSKSRRRYSRSRRRPKKKRSNLQKHSNSLLLVFIVVVIAAALIISISVGHKRKLASVNEGAKSVSVFVMQYEPLIDQYASEYGVEDYKEYLLAIMEVESGGYGSSDVMQSSESAGLPMDTLSEEASVKQGCAFFAECLQEAQDQGCDLKTVIQSYNYGKGFISYVAERGGEYSYDLAVAFAKEQSGGATTKFNHKIAIEANGGWRYSYGNMFYVPLVEQYVSIIRELE